MAVPPRMNLLTLAAATSTAWPPSSGSWASPEAPSSDEHYRVFQLEHCVVLSLWGAHHYAPSEGERAEGFRGFPLGGHVRGGNDGRPERLLDLVLGRF